MLFVAVQRDPLMYIRQVMPVIIELVYVIYCETRPKFIDFLSLFQSKSMQFLASKSELWKTATAIRFPSCALAFFQSKRVQFLALIFVGVEPKDSSVTL